MADVWTGWVGGVRLPATTGDRLVVRHPYDGTPVAEVAWASKARRPSRSSIGVNPLCSKGSVLSPVAT